MGMVGVGVGCLSVVIGIDVVVDVGARRCDCSWY